MVLRKAEEEEERPISSSLKKQDHSSTGIPIPEPFMLQAVEVAVAVAGEVVLQQHNRKQLQPGKKPMTIG